MNTESSADDTPRDEELAGGVAEGNLGDTPSDTAGEGIGEPDVPAEAEVDAEADTGQDEVEADPLSEAMSSISRLEDELARARADYYNLNQEYSNFVKRSKADALARYDEGIAKVIDTLLPVLDDVQLAREHGDLEGTPGMIVEKLEQSLATSFKLERFGEVGDAFDPQIHEALMNTPSAEVESEQVGTLIQPGYRLGERLLRPARVGVLSPE